MGDIADCVLLSTRPAKAFRFDGVTGTWTDSVAGSVSIVLHRESKQLCLVMIEDKTSRLYFDNISTSLSYDYCAMLITDRTLRSFSHS